MSGMNAKNYGTAFLAVDFDMSGWDAIEKTLLSIEPAVVEAKIEYLEEAALRIIALIQSHIPPTFVELQNSIMGIIQVYKGGQKIFLSVGVGGEGAKDIKSLSDDNPIKFGRWQEHGWEPLRWESEKRYKKQKKWMRKQGFSDRDSMEWTGLRFLFSRRQEEIKQKWKLKEGGVRITKTGKNKGRIEHQSLYRTKTEGTTTPKHFIKQSKAVGRELAQKALEEAVAKVSAMFESGELERMFPDLEFQGDNFWNAKSMADSQEKRRIPVYL